ncbi:MAG: hypothetical protein Kow0062_02510 [Acidobacteriota bacterium]|nr:MAG: DUF3137 domain-containing protein [Acidobacteriota bacterium]
MGDVKRDCFSKHEAAVWRQLEGDVIDGQWDGRPLRVQSPPFTVTLDVHTEMAGRGSAVVTRFRAAYVNLDGFRFAVVRRSLMLDLASLFGSQDITIGDPEFDRAFVIRANSEREVRRLFDDEELRRRMLACERLERLEVRDDEGWFGPEFPDGVDELYLEAEGRITDVETLEKLYGVFSHVLRRLCQIGSAYERDPMVDL